MNFDQPSALQKSWREVVRLLGSAVSGAGKRFDSDLCEIHHPMGRKAKHNKLEIGHWWILPLTTAEHNALHGKPNAGDIFAPQDLEELKDLWFIHHMDRSWQEVGDMRRHEFEKFLFEEMVSNITVLPFDDEVREAIKSWSR